MEKAWAECGFHFTLTDLRRTFLSVAERLELPVHTVNGLANRSRRWKRHEPHVEYDIEILRRSMQRITDRLLHLMEQTPQNPND